MNNLIKAAGLSAALAAVVAMPAQAQTGSGSFGLFGGYQLGGHLAEDENDSGEDSDLDYDDEWLGGLSAEFWLGDARRWGLRFDGSYTEGGWDESNPSIPEDTDVNLWMGDANLMYRFAEPDFDTRFLPFLSFGVGAMHWNRADDLELGFLPADAAIPEKATKLALTPSIGADIFLSDAVSLRLEAKDYWNLQSPYTHLGTDDNHDGGHNIQLRAGLNFFWGTRSPAPAPAPRPEPRPEPEPEPEPTTESITRCVVNQNGEIEMVTATRYVNTGRVVVTRNGVEVDFDEAFPARTPVYVRNADWYVRDQPIEVRIGEDVDDTRLTGDATGELTRLEFVRFGSPTTMSPSDLVYVGSINGTPVFARPADVRNIMPRLSTALRTQSDLEAILRADQELARDFSQLRTLYMAVEPDCVFQPISLTTYVRSTRG